MYRTRATVTFLILLLGMPLSAVLGAEDPNLVGWWKLDDGTGAVAKESSGKSLDGAAFGDPVWSTTGIDGGSLLFDGVDDYVFIDTRYRIRAYPMSVGFR